MAVGPSNERVFEIALENLGREARRQWAEALLEAFLRLQNSEEDPESSQPV